MGKRLAKVEKNTGDGKTTGRDRTNRSLATPASQTSAATPSISKETKPQTSQTVFHFVGTESFFEKK